MPIGLRRSLLGTPSTCTSMIQSSWLRLNCLHNSCATSAMTRLQPLKESGVFSAGEKKHEKKTKWTDTAPQGRKIKCEGHKEGTSWRQGGVCFQHGQVIGSYRIGFTISQSFDRDWGIFAHGNTASDEHAEQMWSDGDEIAIHQAHRAPEVWDVA